MTLLEFGKINYEAYTKSNQLDMRNALKWEELSEHNRSAWIQGAVAVLEQKVRDDYKERQNEGPD